jgi:hypothetical protein
MKSTKILKKLFKNQVGGDYFRDDISAVLKLILIVIVIFFIYIYYNNKNTQIENNQNIKNKNKEESDLQIKNIPYHEPHHDPNHDYFLNQRRIVNTLPILRDYDYRTYNDPLTPPYKRDDYMIPAQIVDPVNFGVYTRGIPPVFKKMGYLIDESSSNDDKYKILNLIGRQKFYNSNIYQYYTVSNDRDNNIKFDLGKKYRNELNTGDKVKVHQLNKEYVVHIDKDLDYEYNPYVI